MLRSIVSIVAGWMAMNCIRRWREDPQEELKDVALVPGSWYEVYLNDWMEFFDIDDRDLVTSGIVTGQESGDYIWATETPEWDRDWFNDHGRRFPRKWVHFSALENVDGEPGSPVRLPGL